MLTRENQLTTRKIIKSKQVNDKAWKKTKERIRKDWADGWSTWKIAGSYYNDR